ncbi:MAG: FkbM family methyltransferase [Chloroflexi bacterium]|nr:FkbM family methyltransferase [Chloroflexota bacterium]
MRRTFRNWPTVLTYLAFGRAGVPIRRELKAATRSGTVVCCPGTLAACWPLVEIFVRDEYRLRTLLSEPDLGESSIQVVDVGAHVGSFALALNAMYPSVRCLCVEPACDNFRYLAHNVLQNGLSGRVQLVQAAVTSVRGNVDLYVHGDDGSSLNSTLPSKHARQETVRSLRLDDLFEMMTGRIHILKLDCEGSEHDIVNNSGSSCWAVVDTLVLEYHPVPDQTWNRTQQQLEKLGFVKTWDNRVGSELGVAYFVRGEKVQEPGSVSG